MKACGKLPSRLAAGSVSFGEQTDIVTETEQAFEERAGFVVAALRGQDFDQPEGAGEKNSFARGQSVHIALGVPVAHQEPVDRQLPLNGVHRRDHARIGRGQKPDDRDQERAGVERVRAI